MAKRKKKGNCRKRSLLFVESPVESQQCPLSPLVCADNPITAVSIPIDNNCNISWVSPQFSGIALSHGRRRQVRRRHSTSNRQGEKVNKENSRTRSCRNGSHNKYLALQFVGDVFKCKPTRTAARAKRLREHSKDESVSQVYEENKSKSKTECNKQNVLSISVGHCNSEEDYGCVETVRKRSSFRKSGDRHYRPSLAHRSVYCDCTDSPTNSAHDQSVSSIQRRRSKEVPQVFKHLHSDPHSPQCEGGSLTSDEAKRARRKSYNSDMLLSPLETSDLSQSGRGTPVVTRLCQVPLRVALFTHSPSEGAVNSSTNGCLKQQDPDSQNENSGCDASCIQGAKSLSRGKCRRVGRRHCHSSQSAHEGGKPRRSKRLQDKYREAMGYLQPSTPGERQNSNILVSDTPESQYGLTFKQRMHLKQKTKV